MVRNRVIGTLVAAGLLATLTGCGLVPSDEQAIDTGTTTTVIAVTTTEVASPQAAAVRADAAADTALPADVVTLVQGASGARLDELGQAACGRVTAGMADADIEAAAIVTYDVLAPEETALVDLAEFGHAFRLLLAAYCPATAAAETTTTAAAPAASDGQAAAPAEPADPSAISGYRELLPQIIGADHAAVAFVGAAPDTRIDELQQAACAASSVDMDLTGFGLAVLGSYQTDLTDAERSQVTVQEYAELFGSLVGWFCPDRLPLAASQAAST